MQYKTLVNDCAPESCGVVLACSEQFQLVVFVRLYDRVAFASKNVGNVLCLETLWKILDEL